ncbi:MAG: hypothetical protein M3133_03755, partial [Actinomycetota bacterium]|nr:hypothetical protein [Actinomycetota bacterium]
RLLQYIAEGLTQSNTVIVGTYRDAEVRSSPQLHRLLAAVARHGRRLVLTGLEEAEVGILLEQSTGGPASGDLIRDVHNTTDGNPLFVREMARLLQTETPGEAVPLPEEIHALIRRRLDPVPAPVREVLRFGAVLGRDFDLATLQQASGVPSETLLDRLGEAARLGVVEEVGLGRWSFTHALLREELHDEVRPSERVVLHRRAGEALEEIRGDDLAGYVSGLAYHFFEAARGGDGAKAVDYCTRAGHEALSVLAFEEAALQFSRALEALALRPPVDERRRCELLLAWGEAKFRAGDLSQSRELYRRALKAARAVGSAELLARAALGIYALPETTDQQTARSVLEEARAALPDQDSPLLAQVLLALAATSTQSEARRRLSDEAVAMARRVGDQDTLREVLWGWPLVNQDADQLDLRLAVADELLHIASEAGDRERIQLARQWRASSLFEYGDIPGARRELELAVREAEDLRLPFLKWGATFLLATVALLEGRLDEAERLVHLAAVAGQRSEFKDVEGVFNTQLWALRREQGRFDDMADEALRMWKNYPEQEWAPEVHRVMYGLALAEQGKGGAARGELESVADELLDSHDWWELGGPALVADTSWLIGEARWAEGAYRALGRWPNRHVMIGVANCSFGSSERYLGQMAALLVSYDEAERHFEQAHRLHKHLGAPGWLARGQVDHARMLLMRGGRGDARRASELVDAAREAYRSLGMSAHEARAASLLDTSRGQTATAEEGRFWLEGEYWAIRYGGADARLRDSKGLRYLARLLGNPGQELHALDLVVGEGSRAEVSSGNVTGQGLESVSGGDAGSVLDAQAKAAYRRRVRELQEEMEEASAHHDLG